MVRGIDMFMEYFSEFHKSYVLIGGTATSILFDERGLEFRRTKDLDIVLIVEEVTDEL